MAVSRRSLTGPWPWYGDTPAAAVPESVPKPLVRGMACSNVFGTVRRELDGGVA